MLYIRFFALSLSLAIPTIAADWQATAAAGFGSYHPITFSAPSGNAEAGIGSRYVLNAAVRRAIRDHLAIEAAWTFQDGDFELTSHGTKTAFDANTHAFH